MAFKNDQAISREVCITTNIACNLRCTYCYEKDKDSTFSFDLEQAKKTLSKVLSEPTLSGTIVSFHGGEPFLSYLKIRELCEWAWSQSFKEKYLFFIQSNGTLIHGEIQNWLRKNKSRIIVGLSVDGNEQMQNINRTNSFHLIDINFFVQTWPNQGVKMTISPQTIGSLADGIIYLHEVGVLNIAANLAEMVDWDNPDYLSIYQRELSKLTDFYIAHPQYKECSLYNVKFASVLSEETHKWCGTGTNMRAIDVDGSEYPCHMFFESVCGKELSEKAKYIDFSDNAKLFSIECYNCPTRNICPTCYGANYIARGDISQRDMVMCKFHKIRYAEVAKYQYSKIVNDNTPEENLSTEEKIKRLKTLEGIEKVADFLNL